MSWNEVKKPSQKASQKQKQNIILDNEDLEGLGNDSIFSALSNIDNKEQKKFEDNNSNNNSVNNSVNTLTKQLSKNSSSNSLPSPKLSKKNSEIAAKTTPIDTLSQLNVSNFINKNIKITSDEQDQIDQLKKLCNFIETEITNKIYCATTKFSHKSFDIDNPDFKGPVEYLNPKQRKEIASVFLKCKESVIKKLFVLITRCIFVGEKKAVNTQTISNTIAHQICVQIISNLYPGILYKPGKEGKLVYEQTVSLSKNIIEKLPAIGNTLIWVCKQQHYNVNKKEVYCPEYVGLWLECFLNALTSTDASIAIQTQSVKLLNKVLDGIKENKNKLPDVNVKIPLESFIALVAILKTESVASQIKKRDKLYDGVTKAYEKLKSLLFDRSCNILQFNVSDKDMLIKLYKLLSDPTYDRGVFDEFLNIIVLTFAKEPVLFDTWGSIYSQFQPNNVTLSNSIVKEIKKQQTEYIKSKKYCPEGNCWEELDNDFLKNSFYTIMGTNEEHRNKSNDSEINEMHKNMRSILDKTAKAGRGDGGFFSGLLMKLLKRSALLVILISLALHIFDSVDTYNNAKSDGSRNIKLPAGHPVIPSDGGNINKCPYHQFRVKYTNCSQCHPVIKYVYDWMDEPYKYIESRAIIPAYEKVWKPYCSRAFMNGIQYGIVPAYKYSKPIIKEKVIQPIQKNVIPKAAVMYDTYAKDYVNTANENVFKPAYSTSSKYAKQAYTYLKPVTIKTKDYMINDVVKPSLPYLNKAKVRAIQYGNQFLDVLADIPYKKIMKNGASQTLRFIGATENNMEKLYVASTPYAQKYWEVLSRKSKAVMEQDNVQKIVGHPYVKTTTDAIKNIYNIWSEGTKVSYVYLTQRGPEEGGAKNWKEATDKVSIKKDIRNSIDFTKRFFKGIIEKLDREEEENIQNIQSSKVKEAKVKEANKEKEKEKRNNEEKKKEEKKKEEIPKEKIEKEAKKEKPEKKKEEVPKEKIEKEIPKEKPEKKKEEVPKEKIEKETKKEKLEKEASKKVIYDHINEQADSKKIAIEEAIIKEAKKSQESSSKKTAMEAAKTKESIKFRAKEVLKDQTKSKKPIVTESDAKQIAKEKAKIRSESKRIVKEEFQKNIAKKLAKEEARSKQTIKDHALEDTKQAVRDHYEETKKVAKDQAVKKVILKEEKQKTKQIAKERSQYTKEIAKEKNEAIKHAKEENKDNKE